MARRSSKWERVPTMASYKRKYRNMFTTAEQNKRRWEESEKAYGELRLKLADIKQRLSICAAALVVIGSSAGPKSPIRGACWLALKQSGLYDDLLLTWLCE